MSERMDEGAPGGGSGGDGANSRERREQKRYGEVFRLNQEQEREIRLLRSRLQEAEEAGFKGRAAAIDAEIDRETEAARRSFADGDPEGHVASVRKVAELAAEKAVAAARPRGASPANGSSAPAQTQFTTTTQAWMDANPWYHSQPDQRAAAMAAHGAAVAARITADTPEYWGFIRERVNAAYPGLVQEPDGFPGAAPKRTEGEGEGDADHVDPPPAQRDAGAAAAAGRQGAASGAAPVSRAAGPKPGGELRLTPEQLEIAKSIGITPQAYLAELQGLQKSGAIAAPAGRR